MRKRILVLVRFLASTGNALAQEISLNLTDSVEYCDTLYYEGCSVYTQNHQWQQCYDTLKKFIETCPNAPESWRAFGAMSVAAQNLNNPTNDIIYDNFQFWLESVMYLNTTDPEYFCACVESLPLADPADSTAATLQLGTNRALALDRWLLQNTTCDTGELRSDYNAGRTNQIITHEIDSADGNYYPLDTTLPPLDSIQSGLQELLEKHLLYADVPENYVGMISNVTTNPNPVTSGTVISFGISKEAYVKIELFDVLGHEVGSAEFESLFEPGNNSVSISLAELNPGTYFARIATNYGETHTVKIVKE